MDMGKLQSKNKVTILKYELHDQHVHEIRGLGSNGTVNTVKWGSGVEPLP